MKLKLLSATLLVMLLAACQFRRSTSFAPPVDKLAKVANITVGTHQLYLPLVAVTWAGRSMVSRPCPEDDSWLCAVPLETLVEYSGIKGGSISATRVDIELENYSLFRNTKFDDWLSIPQLCDMLTQRWARQQCSGPSLFRDNLGRFTLLRRFTLIEVDSLAKINSLPTISGQKEPVGKVVQRMRFVSDAPNTDCASDTQPLCTAAIRISNKVLVVWIVSKTDVHSIRKQAAAIRAFLKSAAGQKENYDDLKAALSSTTQSTFP